MVDKAPARKKVVPVRTPTAAPSQGRKSGEKAKRSPTIDSPEDNRIQKRSNQVFSLMMASQPRTVREICADDDNVSSGSDVDSVPTGSPRPGNPQQQTTVMSMNDANMFGAILRNALQDPETTKTLREMFKPIMEDHTKTIKKEIETIKVDLTAYQGRTVTLENKVQQLELENSNLNQVVQQQQRFMESVDSDQRKHNLIVTGINEVDGPAIHTPDGEDLVSDSEKIEFVLNHIGHVCCLLKFNVSLSQ